MTEWQGRNLLCFGDNLQFLTDMDMFPNECVDLIYLDPPFNSQQNYNVLFKEASGTPEAAQFKAFEDTWRWDTAANDALTRIHTDRVVPRPLVELMNTLMKFLKPSPMMAYLAQMAIRLVHMHRVLKRSGSLYLHCDPTASHYLKLLLDGIFGPTNFRNEIIWQRTSAHANVIQKYAAVHDVLLFYTASSQYSWNPALIAYEREYLDMFLDQVDEKGRRYFRRDLTASMSRASSGQLYEWKGIRPPPSRCWAMTKERMDELDAQGKIHWPKKVGGMPRLKLYAEELPGVPCRDLWTDIKIMHNLSAERMGYPTQKPLSLLQRIVSVSSNPGDVVLDPFCGCGTTIDAVEVLNAEIAGVNERMAREARQKRRKKEVELTPLRTWIGIDVTHLSINLIKHRLTRFTPPPVYEVIGEPGSLSGAAALARQDPYQFQFWALGLIGARPWGGRKKKGADQGIDGVRYFLDEYKGGNPIYRKMLVQVKSGKVGSKDVRDLVGTLSREQVEMGVFITLAEPTAPMKQEAASAGTYISPWGKKPFPRIQILTIEELMADPYRPNPRCLLIPGGSSGQHTLADPPKFKSNGPDQGKLFGADQDGHRPPTDAEDGDDEA
jgi:site-specific DNA-methyltransferase (adenine-specific)